jgi:exonuclease SbcC
MRPLRLEICAFGPFAEKEVIDFAEIAGASLVLIHGPTGSGKTTILDAICFSLFGDTSGAEREGKQMRCDGAPPTLPTSVRYEFALGAKTYCVERSPEQERPSKRGGGMTTDAHQATLWETTNASNDSDEGKVLASGAAKVKKVVSELFGFDSEQFRQVVMLPQGQFRKLLNSESKEKEKILQRLFQTTHYAKLERALADRASKLKRGFEDHQVEMETLLRQEEVETLEDLVLRIGVAKEQHELALGKLPPHKEGSEVASAALSQGQSDNKILMERKAALASANEVQARAKDMSSLRSQYLRAQSALPLIPRADAAKDRATEADAAEAKLKQTSAEVEKSQERKAIAVAALAKEESRSEERDQVAKTQASLEAMDASVQRLEEFRAKESELHALLQKQEAGHAEAASAVASAKSALEAVRTRSKEDDKKASQVEVLEISLQQNRSAKKKRASLESLRTKIKKGQKTHQDAESAFVEKKKQAQQCDQTRLDLEDRWQRGQAGALARELAEGGACPVCGSEDHPKLAEASDSLPSEEAMAQAREAVGAAQEASAEAQERASTSRAVLQSDQEQEQGLSHELAESATREIAAWESEIREQSASLDSALQARERASGSSGELAAAEASVESADKVVQAIMNTLAEKKIEAAKTKGSVEELEKKVPPHLRPTGSLAAAKAELQKKSQALTRALAQAQSAASVAEQDLAACQASRAGASSAASTARGKATEAAQELEVHSGQAGFEDIADFVSAKEAVSMIAEWESRLKEHEGEVKASADRLKRAEEAAEGKALADIEALEQAAADAKAALVVAIRAEAETKHLRDRLSKTQTDYERVRKKVAKQEEQYLVVASISDLANGKVPPKMSFQRFVLAALLDEVLLAATARLAHMSKGRFSLQRQAESRHKARASGLDLEVMDAYTGKARAVATLSGGESFLAALALSLGLADFVQGFTGGIRLDTLLIDEGFGTLDSDALDLALDTLTELNAEGRLVGIISHVDELKTRIPTRLEVLKSELGSRTRFVGE